MSDEQNGISSSQSPALGNVVGGAGRVGPCYFPLGAMSLLDYFSAQAMCAAISAGWLEDGHTRETLASFSYKMGAAMLEARK